MKQILKTVQCIITLMLCVTTMFIIKLLPLKRSKKFRIQTTLYDFFLFLKTRLTRNLGNVAKKHALLNDYTRFIVRYLISGEYAHQASRYRVKHDRLLNYTLFFSTYESMFAMFNEIFGHEVYAFKADNHAPIIIDCGSNIGLATLYFKTLYPKATVVCFEPCPETFAILEKNIISNELSNVTIHNKAAHSHETEIPFYVSSHNIAHGGWSVKAEINLKHTVHEKMIQAIPLSQYITEPIDLLKIDIEGAEIPVLDELAHSGKLALIKQIILEYHHHMVDPNQDCLARILKHFEDYNFGYQFNAVELATSEKNHRNVLILHVYNKGFSKIIPYEKNFFQANAQ